MKKHFIYLGFIAAAAFTLTNCAKEFENPSQQPDSAGIPFEITASTPDTKTANDGMNTKWVSGDQINLFHAVEGATTYTSDKAFTVNDVNSGLFKGTLTGSLTDDTAYDWYAFYPYTAKIESPKNDKGYAYIGNKNGLTQNGYGNKSNLSGLNCPLYGVAKAVPASQVPSVTMENLASVLAINVTNETDSPVTIKDVSFTADEDIVGSFYIDFSDAPKYTASDAEYVSKTAKVTVNNGEALEKGDDPAIVYLIIKPFTASVGDKLTLVVNGTDKEITLDKEVKFEAGKIKTINFKYNEVAQAKKVNVSEFLAAEVSTTQLYELTGTIVGITEISASYKNATLTLGDDNGNEVLIYRMKPADGGTAIEEIGLTVGDQLTVQGYRGEYGGSPQMAQYGYYVSHKDACESPMIQCSNNTVTITSPTIGAKIYYTTGTDYSEYIEPFEIYEDETVKAYAVADGMLQSVVVTEECIWEDPNAGEKYYVKVTSTPTDWTGEYLIVYEAGSVAFDGSLTTLDAANNNKSITISDGKIEATAAMKAIQFTIDASCHIKSASGYYIGNTANSNKLNSSTSTQYTNTITLNTDGTVHIVGSGNSVLRYNSASDNCRFRYFKSSTYTSQKAIHLYKLN